MADRYYRRVIRVTAEDSPNVVLAREQAARGLLVTGEIILPGVLSWGEYQHRLATWDEARRCVGLDGLFYEGAQVMLFPPAWLHRAGLYAQSLRGGNRYAKSVGVDSAEGGDRTSLAAIDEFGLIELVSRKTPDTSFIIGETLAFARKHNCPANKVIFDRGGGGKEHADRLRNAGYPVRTVGFGESVTLDIKRGLHQLKERKELVEDRYAYKNRRAEMYGELSLLLDPSLTLPNGDEKFYAIPDSSWGEEYERLAHQLSVIPRLYDEEGRLYLPSKSKRNNEDTRTTLTEMVGYSPDELDSFVLAVHGMLHEAPRSVAGAI